MDTSKEYILLCKKAIEIQTMRVPMWGFCRFENDDLFSKNNGIHSYFIQPKTEGTVWLPRQDQLQEMIKDKFHDLADLIDYFYTWCNNSIETPKYMSSIYQEVESFEVLWLMYVMKVKFNKQWNNQTYEWELIK